MLPSEKGLHYRMSSEMQALESLIRWRRFHPRANVEELKESLIAIGRKDILNVYVTEAFMYNFELIDISKSLQEC